MDAFDAEEGRVRSTTIFTWKKARIRDCCGSSCLTSASGGSNTVASHRESKSSFRAGSALILKAHAQMMRQQHSMTLQRAGRSHEEARQYEERAHKDDCYGDLILREQLGWRRASSPLRPRPRVHNTLTREPFLVSPSASSVFDDLHADGLGEPAIPVHPTSREPAVCAFLRKRSSQRFTGETSTTAAAAAYYIRRPAARLISFVFSPIRVRHHPLPLVSGGSAATSFVVATNNS